MHSLLTAAPDALLERLTVALAGSEPPGPQTPFCIAGLEPEQYEAALPLLPSELTQAAVLVPIVRRPTQLTVLFTERAAHLKRHGGQISFPGGRMEASDESPLQTALRETEEEIGLSRDHVRLLGYLQPHGVFTGYAITPVIAVVQPDFELHVDEGEVASVFEVPLAYLLDPSHHESRNRRVGDLSFRVYDIPYGSRRIWGATAGMVMSLYRLVMATW